MTDTKPCVEKTIIQASSGLSPSRHLLLETEEGLGCAAAGEAEGVH